jgi:hypothetical protein
MLAALGYISRREADELLYGVKTGDHNTYKRLQELLIEFAKELGRLL